MQPNGLRGLYLLSLLTFLLVLAMFVISLLHGGSLMLRSSSGKTGNDFYDSQNAMVLGKVTQVKDGVVTVENKKGQKMDLPVSKTVLVMGGDPSKPAPPESSSDLKRIEIGKEYTVTLVGTNGVMEVSMLTPTTNIAPPVPAVAAPPASVKPATNSATPASPAARP